jgi:hypothetical protein
VSEAVRMTDEEFRARVTVNISDGTVAADVWRTRKIALDEADRARKAELAEKARADKAEASVKALREALEQYVYNGHHASGVAEGKHQASGFCRTCADQYFAAQRVLISDN